MSKKHRYILVNYAMKPRDPAQSGKKGYTSDPQNQKWDEIIRFSIGLKSKDEINNRIVIDIDGQVVVKNNINDNSDWSQLMNYFMNNYEQQIVDFMKRTGG